MNTPYEPDPPAQRWVPALASAACESARPWYVMMSKPRQEQHAASKLREQGYDVCLLMLEQWVRRAGALSRKQAVMLARHAAAGRWPHKKHPRRDLSGQIRARAGVPVG